MSDESPTKQLFVDASVFITLAETDYVDLLDRLDGEVVVPRAVADEVSNDPAKSHLDAASEEWLRITDAVEVAGRNQVEHAANHLDADLPNADPADYEGDVALLAFGTTAENPVVVTDDRPLRNACKTLGVSLSGSIGVLIAAVERGTLAPDEAKDALVAFDEVGARLSARLLRRAENLIDRAGE
jgi:predicted nucleic acid-binding protein